MRPDDAGAYGQGTMARNDPDQRLEDDIESLITREHALREHHLGRGLTDAERRELDGLQVRLDQLWDLLRQRRARRAAGEDPATASERDEDTVEHYEQ
jgi:hypothetical protein